MKLFVTLFALLIGVAGFSQNTEVLNEKITVVKHADVDYLKEKQILVNQEKSTANGFRIQVASTNNRTEAYRLKSELYQTYSRFKAYLVYEQPYYKLRIGDFTTNLQALQYLEEVMDSYPAAWIVPDGIKIKN